MKFYHLDYIKVDYRREEQNMKSLKSSEQKDVGILFTGMWNKEH